MACNPLRLIMLAANECPTLDPPFACLARGSAGKLAVVSVKALRGRSPTYQRLSENIKFYVRRDLGSTTSAVALFVALLWCATRCIVIFPDSARPHKIFDKGKLSIHDDLGSINPSLKPSALEGFRNQDQILSALSSEVPRHYCARMLDCIAGPVS